MKTSNVFSRSIKEEIQKDHFRIYPNPANSYFIAEYKTNETVRANMILRISDISGKTVKLFLLNANANHSFIPTKDLKQGIYLCKFVVNGMNKKTVKLTIVQ